MRVVAKSALTEQTCYRIMAYYVILLMCHGGKRIIERETPDIARAHHRAGSIERPPNGDIQLRYEYTRAAADGIVPTCSSTIEQQYGSVDVLPSSLTSLPNLRLTCYESRGIFVHPQAMQKQSPRALLGCHDGRPPTANTYALTVRLEQHNGNKNQLTSHELTSQCFNLFQSSCTKPKADRVQNN